MIPSKKQIEVIEAAGFKSEGGGVWVIEHAGYHSQTTIIAAYSNTHRIYFDVRLLVRLDKGGAVNYQLGHMTAARAAEFALTFKAGFKHPHSSL